MLNILLFIQNWYSYEVAQKLFGTMADHLFDKWISCNQNLINYFTMLDDVNTKKLLDWGKSNLVN